MVQTVDPESDIESALLIECWRQTLKKGTTVVVGESREEAREELWDLEARKPLKSLRCSAFLVSRLELLPIEKLQSRQ
jgi:hypothetical protein